jgi:hypothetical protein
MTIYETGFGDKDNGHQCYERGLNASNALIGFAFNSNYFLLIIKIYLYLCQR